MSRISWLLLLLSTPIPALAQTSVATPELPKESAEVFAAAVPFYNFNDETLKSWHLKATYQLYDDNGKPAEQGTYEYWWASPLVHRSTWTRPGATHTDWYTADGKHAYYGVGERLKFFEYQLQSQLFSPLPEPGDLDPARSRFQREAISLGSVKFPCIMIIPQMPLHGRLQTVPMGIFPTYCFDPKAPVLRLDYSLGTVATEFNKIVRMQNRYLAREITMLEGTKKILTANVDAITALSPADPALTPSPEIPASKIEKPVDIAGGIAAGSVIKKQAPFYPQDAKQAGISGTVILEALIGMDGAVHNLRVISAPWPSLASASLWAVSQWQYKPYILNGEPVEVKTTINVIFALGN